MRILGIDTTGSHCQVALRDDDTVLGHLSEAIGRGHAERLAPMVVELLGNLPPASVDRIAVVTGPGSFTGLRVGLSFALGFALPHDIPVLGFTTLEVAAHAEPKPTALFTQDVRRGEVAMLSKTDGVMSEVKIVSAEAAASATAEADHHIADPVPDLLAATRLARAASPLDHPPTAFYARPPDAKLPGGKLPDQRDPALAR